MSRLGRRRGEAAKTRPATRRARVKRRESSSIRTPVRICQALAGCVGLAIRWRTYDRLVGAFANAVLADGRRPSLTLCWLAGLLEAEDSFLKPTPTDPNLPIVDCPMTDRDVVECVAELFGVSPAPIDKGDRKTQYVARLKGSVAVALMRDLRPLMGARRQLAIDRALRLYHAPERKLSYPASEDIRRRHDAERRRPRWRGGIRLRTPPSGRSCVAASIRHLPIARGGGG
jgi:hypothetical protein